MLATSLAPTLMRLNPAVKRERDINRFNPVSSTAKRRLFFCRRTDTKQLIEIPTIYLRQHSIGPAANGGAGPVPSFKNWNPVLARCLALPAVAKLACRHPTLKNTQSIRALFCILLLAIRTSPAAAGSEDLIELKKAGDTLRFTVKSTGKEFASVMPDSWQGNLQILSPEGEECGVAWPHFLMNSEGKWLADKIESEGMTLLDFKVLQPAGLTVGYHGNWRFRDYFTSSETHFTWFDAAFSNQVHLVKTRLQVLKDLEDINAIWVEFMTRENSHQTAAAKIRGGTVITLDVSQTGPGQNMHYWDDQEIVLGGWVAICGSQSGHAGSAVMIPLATGSGSMRPRVNNGHVDNIELHLLDPRKRNPLRHGQEFFLEYLLIAGPNRQDRDWVAPAVKRARAFMKKHRILLTSHEGSDHDPSNHPAEQHLFHRYPSSKSQPRLQTGVP